MRMRIVATTTDAGTLAALHAQCFAEQWSAQWIADLLATPGTFAAFSDGEGFALVRAAGGESELLTVAVVPAARRRGVGSALVEAASHHAAEWGATVMFLEVSCTNYPAIALYKRLGFNEVARRKGYYAVTDGNRQDALVMKSEIPLTRVCNRLQLG